MRGDALGLTLKGSFGMKEKQTKNTGFKFLWNGFLVAHRKSKENFPFPSIP
jgi:hypothetical protein